MGVAKRYCRRGIWPRQHWPRGAPDPWSATFHKAVHRLDARPDAIVLLVGPRGVGKTQMLAELMLVGRSGGVAPALYRTVAQLYGEIRATFNRDALETENDVRARFVHAPLLCIDEIGERVRSEWTDHVLTAIVDERYGAERPTIIAGNPDPKRLTEDLGPSIASRAKECGGLIRCEWESYR